MSRLMKYQPIHVLSDINKLFEQTFFPQQHYADDSSNIDTAQWVPAVDVKEETNRFLIRVDVPGIDKKDIQISMHNGVLSIQGERAEEKQLEGENYYRVERVSGKFYRRFSLPEGADGENIEANINKGVLDIIIPKKQLKQAKTISINEG